MPMILGLKARRDALSAQRSSGVARVSYDGKTVDYRSVAEIDRAIEALDREIAAAEGRRIVPHLQVDRPACAPGSRARCPNASCGDTAGEGAVEPALDAQLARVGAALAHD